MDNSVIKAEAQKKGQEANLLCSSESMSDKKRGVELFLQAQELEWGERLVPNKNFELPTRIPYSDEFLGACQSLAAEAFQAKQDEEAMKYCEYVRNSYYFIMEDSDGLSTSFIQSFLYKHLEKRPGAFNPEMFCAELEIALCMAEDSPFYNLQEALYKKRCAAALGSVKAINMLANQYYEAATNLAEAKEAYFFYSLLNYENDQEFDEKKKAAWDKFVGMMAGNVTRVFMNPETWLPAPMEASMTWERYSGLTEEACKKLSRKPIDDRIVIWTDNVVSERINGTDGYQPGVIDLNALWQQFVSHPQNQKVDKQVLCFKKKKYNECLYMGDFVDCCKYLWEQTYKK